MSSRPPHPTPLPQPLSPQPPSPFPRPPFPRNAAARAARPGAPPPPRLARARSMVVEIFLPPPRTPPPRNARPGAVVRRLATCAFGALRVFECLPDRTNAPRRAWGALCRGGRRGGRAGSPRLCPSAPRTLVWVPACHLLLRYRRHRSNRQLPPSLPLRALARAERPRAAQRGNGRSR